MKDYLGNFTLNCPNQIKCPHASFMHDITEGFARPVCSAQDCLCGRDGRPATDTGSNLSGGGPA